MKTNVLTINEVVKKLQMSKSTIYKYAENGKIPSFKIGACLRFFKKEIDKYLLNLSQKKEIKC
jgi:PTS system nitrogen regulatory IIA component